MDLSKVVRPDASTVALKTYLYERFFASWAGAMRGSLFFAVAYILFWLIPMAILYRRRIFLRI